MSNPYDPYNPQQGQPGQPYGQPIPSGGGGGYGAPSPYGQGGYEPPKKTDAVSITGFILSLTCCLSLIGLILGIVGLGRTKNGQRKGRWAAICALIFGILGTLAVIAAVIGFVFLDKAVVDLDEAQRGVCMNVDDDDNDAVILYKKECSESHDAEIVYAGEAGADASRLQNGLEAGTVCAERAGDDLDGVTFDYTLGALTENPDNVKAGDRFVCYVERFDGAKLTGSQFS